jgi:hypothetical protein
MSPRGRISAAAFFFLAVVVCACGGMPSGTAPTQALNVSGRWSGTGTDSQGVTVVEWTLVQNGTTVTGTVRTNAPDPADGSCNSCHRNKSGTVTGTVSGTQLGMTMTFAAGVDGDPTPICSATMTGTAALDASAGLGGAYTGSDTCEGAFLNGNLTMTRRR